MAMFSNNKETPQTGEVIQSETRVGKGVIFNGDLETSGNVRIDGYIVGNVKSKSRVVLGDTAKIFGELLAQNAEIAGEIKGRLLVNDILSLKATSVIEGDIRCNKLIVESGAVINGSTQMGNFAQEIVLTNFEDLVNKSPVLEKMESTLQFKPKFNAPKEKNKKQDNKQPEEVGESDEGENEIL